MVVSISVSSILVIPFVCPLTKHDANNFFHSQQKLLICQKIKLRQIPNVLMQLSNKNLHQSSNNYYGMNPETLNTIIDRIVTAPNTFYNPSFCHRHKNTAINNNERVTQQRCRSNFHWPKWKPLKLNVARAQHHASSACVLTTVPNYLLNLYTNFGMIVTMQWISLDFKEFVDIAFFLSRRTLLLNHFSFPFYFNLMP